MVWCAEDTVKYPYDPDEALKHFRRADSTLFGLTEEIGNFCLELSSKLSPFEALLRSIVFQQLSGFAANSILSRVLAKYSNKFPTPEEIRETAADDLRGCGLSWAKVRSVNDLAEKTYQGQLPTAAEIPNMSDQELIKAFTIVHGIGPWTVEMMLIFNLGRPDVLPVSDLGVQRGYMVVYGNDELPSSKELAAAGACWKPYRSVASWYLWRAADRKFRK